MPPPGMRPPGAKRGGAVCRAKGGSVPDDLERKPEKSEGTEPKSCDNDRDDRPCNRAKGGGIPGNLERKPKGEEFEPEKAWWTNRVENEQAWRVSIDQIRAGGFNLDLKNPNKPDEGPGDIDHLLPEYERLLAQIAETRSLLKQELHHALTASAGSAE